MPRRTRWRHGNCDRRVMTGEPPQASVRADPAARVSFMITLSQKRRLRELGYSEAAISAMTPEVAHQILQLAT